MIGISIMLAAAGLTVYMLSGRGGPEVKADPSNPRLVALGAQVHGEYCAACHGASLEGQADWQRRRLDGRLPAPPHDETGHTWHHPDRLLFDITKHGVAVLGIPGYESDMPAFRGTLTDDDIWAVLAYIKSRWPQRIQDIQAEINARSGR